MTIKALCAKTERNFRRFKHSARLYEERLDADTKAGHKEPRKAQLGIKNAFRV